MCITRCIMRDSTWSWLSTSVCPPVSMFPVFPWSGIVVGLHWLIECTNCKTALNTPPLFILYKCCVEKDAGIVGASAHVVMIAEQDDGVGKEGWLAIYHRNIEYWMIWINPQRTLYFWQWWLPWQSLFHYHLPLPGYIICPGHGWEQGCTGKGIPM